MKRTVIFGIAIIFLCFRATSQELPTYKKKMYVSSSDHKIFINKSMPVYLFISTSSDAKAVQVRLKSQTVPQYTNPMYFASDGKNLIWSPWAVDTVTKKVVYPKRDVQFQVYVDGKPPTTRIIFDKSHEYYNKGIHYLPDPATFELKAADDLSGVETTYFSIDSGPYNVYTTPVPLQEEKEYSINYFSVDHTGNGEPVKHIKIEPDKTPPASKMEVIGEKYEDILPGNAWFNLTADDKISGVNHIYYSIDDSIFRLYTGKISTAPLSQGGHKLYYYSTDWVNHKEKINAYSFYVDNTPPQVIEEMQGKTFMANGKEYSAGTSKLRITSFDNKAGVKDIYYSINNAPYKKYDKPIVLSGYRGTLIVNSYAVDNVGNQSQVNMSNSRKNALSYIDLTGPWVGHSFTGPVFSNRDTLFISNKTHILLEARDTESGVDRVEYQTDSSDLNIYHTPFSLSKEGFHRISVFGYDHIENLTRQTFEVVVDTAGPRIFERFSSPPVGTVNFGGTPINVYPNTVVIFLSATDDRSGYESLWYQLNNSQIQPYLKDIRGFIPGKKNTLKVKAIDKLGNQNIKEIEFSVQ